ncbi:lysozyme-like [Battus philenor]|uniref:lysozyme-like n=1 Tax=Battus philenor TaxID=42288 RepID=UPI0035D057BE
MKCLVLLLTFIVFHCEAYQMSRCELVQNLRNHGFPEKKLRDWVCLVEAQSSSCTHLVSKLNKSGHREYGLFQLSDKYWCSNTGKPGNDCNVTCSDLLSDDITKAARCAKLVYKRHGFNAWNGWKNKCQNSLPDISFC